MFDALRYTKTLPVALEIQREGEYTPIKQAKGANSVEAAVRAMTNYWGGWLEDAGTPVERDAKGNVVTTVEISPAFAMSKEEFIKKTGRTKWQANGNIAIDARGQLHKA